MSIDFRLTYRESEEYTKVALFGLFVLVLGALVGSIFLSPAFVLAVVFGVISIILTFARPTWMLGALLFFLPFEPFLLKWVSDDLYVYAGYASEVLVYLLVFATLWRVITGAVRQQTSPIDVPFILFLLLLVGSSVINLSDPWFATLGIRQIVRFMLLFFVTLYLRPDKKWMQVVVSGLFVIAAVQMALGISQFFIGAPLDTFLLPGESRSVGEITLTEGTVQFWDFGQRVFGTLGRYDRLGAFLAFVMLIAASMLYEPEMRKKYGKWLPVFLLVGLAVLLLTYSRASWFSFVLGFGLIAVVIRRDMRVVLAGAAAAAAIALYLLFSGLVVDRLIDVSDQTLAERFFEAFSYERWRGEYYGLGRTFWAVQTVTAVVPASPIFGHGPGYYGGGAAAALGNSGVYDDLGIPFGVYGTEGYIDSNWFALWGETGTVGLGLYLWLYIALFVYALRLAAREKDPFYRALAYGVAAAMLGIAFNAMLSTIFEIRTTAVYLWTFTALLVVIGTRQEYESS